MSSQDKCNRGRGSNWSTEESACLLQAFKERKVINKLDGKEYRHLTIMKLLSEDLRAHGYVRSADQIKTRLKTMKDQYNKIQNSLKKSGAGGKIDWVHYSDMHEIYSSRPSANRRGVDSARNVLVKQSGSGKSSSAPSKIASSKTTLPINKVLRKPALDNNQLDPDSVFNDENMPPAHENLLPASQREVQNFVQSETDLFEIENPHFDAEDQSLPPPESSKLGAFIMTEQMGANKDSLEESTEEMNADESENAEGGSADSTLGIDEIFEKDREEESLYQKRKKPRQAMEDEKKKLLETLIAKRAEDTKTVISHQEKMQNKATEDFQRILQQNCLLLIQAFAMSQNHSQMPAQTAGSSFMPPPFFHGAPNAYSYPGLVPGYPGQVPGGFSASPIIPNQPYVNNYFGAQIPGAFCPPLIPNVPNTQLFPGLVTGSGSPVPNLITQPHDIDYNSQIVGNSTEIAGTSCSQDELPAESFDVLSQKKNDVPKGVFDPPVIPNVPNTDLFLGSGSDSVSPASNLIIPPHVINYNSQIFSNSAEVDATSYSQGVLPVEPLDMSCQRKRTMYLNVNQTRMYLKKMALRNAT